jgi:uncharacterized membrane protein YebE (DUF533 family)
MNKDVFIALASIAWADGTIDPDEADAIVRAAADEGLPIEEIAAIEEATKNPVDLSTLDRSTLSNHDRLFVYAVACWIARIDGYVTEEETAALAQIGERLRIPDKTRERAWGVVEEVSRSLEGDRPARFDLPALKRILGEKLAG